MVRVIVGIIETIHRSMNILDSNDSETTFGEYTDYEYLLDRL